MKIAYKHLVENISSSPSINEISEKLFQLGHEHEIIDNKIFDMELTPNRGDCLSIRGLLRDLRLFYEIKLDEDIYEKMLDPLDINFKNNAINFCKTISFLKVEIDEIPLKYNNKLSNYFSELNLNSNNFFTDISNYISYETGQPTHCYDSVKLGNELKLDFTDRKISFDTLLGEKVELQKDELVFLDGKNNVINLAGIVGGADTACDKKTKSAIIECAHFSPEIILGKSVLYDIKSDASHKFERDTDPFCHEFILRRFIKLIEDHTNLKKIEMFSQSCADFNQKIIPYDLHKINKILGTDLSNLKCVDYLTRLGFEFVSDSLKIPTYRNDIENINDIAEEIARAVGYDNIQPDSFNISFNNKKNFNIEEKKVRELLINNGFYEVINNPFVSANTDESITIDNPIDSTKNFLRTNLQDSLLQNLLYNERRQQDSIKLFEIADVYLSGSTPSKRLIGIIASGRVDKNYRDFSKQINNKYIESILKGFISNVDYQFIDIPRNKLDTKIKNHISYLEIEIDSSFKVNYEIDRKLNNQLKIIKYRPISDFPSSVRDISFSVKDFKNCKKLEKMILEFENDLLKDTYTFDYFNNDKKNEIKIGFRFIFQSRESTITDAEVNKVINSIIECALRIDSVRVPGLN
jgi:phenylalanyl-tRNA synthetase beta chain